jgi:4-hydroxy-tetrahydrodipicolinate synthase
MTAKSEPGGRAGLNLAGLWLPLITPLRDDRPDLQAMQFLAQAYARSGIAGLVLFGSTGEGNLFSLEEKASAFKAVREAAPAMPIMLGAGGVDTRAICLAIRELDKLQPDGWLIPPPYYLRPAPDGILWHYRQAARASARPIVIYNIPKRTGTALSLDLMERLCASASCVAVKECDPALLAALRLRGGPAALCGEDLALLDHCAAGGAGVISASAHIRPDLFLAVMELARSGRLEDAAALFAPLRPLIELLFQEPNPAPIKRALACLGLIADELRLPMTRASEALGKQLEQAMAALPAENEVASLMHPA